MRLDIDGLGVQTHLTILQSIIGRLSTLGGGIKMLAATVVGIVAVLGDRDLRSASALGGFVLVLWGLDGYYLAKERWFRRVYSRFVNDLQSNKVLAQDLFTVEKPALKSAELVKAAFSPSIWVFYVAIFILSFVTVVARDCQ